MSKKLLILPFIAASLLIASTVFAANAPKPQRTYGHRVTFDGIQLKNSLVGLVKEDTSGNFSREIAKQAKIPTGAEIWALDFGVVDYVLGGEKTKTDGPIKVSEDGIYDLESSTYRSILIKAYVKMPSAEELGMGIVQIWDQVRQKEMQLTMPKRGKVIDIMNAYQEKITIPDGEELSTFYDKDGMMDPQDPYTTEDLSKKWIMPAYRDKAPKEKE